MNGMKKLSVILMLLSLTACASGVQRTVYYEYRPPISHASVHTTVNRYQPIEVTVYADRLYRGGFSTIQLVMVDGEYAGIPMRNKKGNYTRIFAHYYAGVLHFDSDRNCHGIQGASRFNHDNGWHKGQMYTRVSAGKDYNLTGLKIMVRNVDQSKKSAVANNDKLRHEKERNIHPEHANVDNKSIGQDRLLKSDQKKTVAAKNIIVSQKNSPNRVDERVNKKSIETERQARATNSTPDSGSQTVNRFNQKSDHEKRNDQVAKVRKSLEEKADREKNNDPQNVKLSKNEPKRTVAQKTLDERKNHSAKPNALEKPGMTHVDKSNDRHQPKEKEKNSVAENKHAQKDRKGIKNKNDEDDNDEENSLDDELSKGNGKKRQAT
jgi:hypothetical protein